MQTKGKCKRVASRALVALLAVALVFTMMPLNRGYQAHATEALTVQTPVLLVTGQGLIGNGGAYSAQNVSREKSYTLDELKGLTEAQGKVTKQKYSAMKSQEPFAKNYYLVDGVRVDALLGTTEDAITDDVRVIATDTYATQFLQGQTYTNGMAKTVGINNARYFYDFATGERGEQVPAVIGWADVNTGLTDGSAPEALPSGDTADLGFLRLYCGQYDGEGGGVADMNQPLWNGKDTNTYVNKVQEGDAIDEVILTVNGESYKRSDVLMMDFAERAYTYETQGGNATDNVRGVPFSVLLKDEDENAEVSFEAADGYDMSSATKTVKELVEKNYMLAYEVNGKGIYNTAKGDASKYGLLAMYGDGVKPAKMINKVTVGGGGIDFSTSPYKHVTNGGIEGQDGPYNIDSITGATLTIEGPGVKTSVPLSVRDLETRTKGCVRAVYDDTRSGAKATRTYEGIDLYYLLHNMNTGSNGIVLTDKAYQVKIKNRNRNTIATLTLDQIEKMHNGDKPALVSYGTGNEDGTNPRPFVFDGATGADKNLGNEDGCLKFVYDTDKYGDQDGKYTKFGNMAYIYVEEQEAPGFKHTNEGSPYNVVDNTEAIISFTGDTLGREVNYTVKDIENLVEYKADGTVDESNGYGYRDNYSLTNTTYWYVNEYEGVKLWSMLLHSGLDPELANDDTTKINYQTSDNYSGTDKFTIKQTANDDLFGFYEKNALDNNDGTYEPNENIRKDNDPSTGDKLAVGYPVLLAYGVNSYPYVISSKLDGYLSGLSNDGGPLRVISGKTNYKHNNGSSQAQKFSGVVVGSNDYHYATHKYHSDKVYKDLAANELTVNINTVKGGETKTTTKKYTIGDIEDINYDGKLTPTKLKEAKVKAKYNTGKFADLYEGVNLSYFLKDVVELTGSEGTVTFTGSDNTSMTLSLSDVLTWSEGYCKDSGLNNLVPVLAYGKNGMPMVNKKTTPEGFVPEEILAEGTKFENKLTIKNQNGPLQAIFPGSKDGSVAAQDVKDVVSIDINLTSDKYAHVETPYDTYADNEITISGEGTKLTEAKKFTVAELEGKQTLAGTYDYSMRKSSGSTSTARYRGIKLYDFLKSTNVGLKSNADKVIVKTRDGSVKEFSMADIIKTDYINSEDSSVTELPVILAYGSAATDNADKKDGKPLVTNKSGEGSDGYDAAYGNSGGPLKLVIGQTDAETANSGLCMSDVVSIEVTASAVTNWNHSSSSTFASYLDNKVTFEAVDSDNKTLFTKEYTVKELEAMDSLITRATLHLENDNEWEGLDLWGLIQSVMGDVKGIDNPVNVYVYSRDGFNYNVMEQGLDALKNGVKEGNDYLPILLAYGCDGYPLAQFGKNDPAGPGYDSTIGNGNGPLRAVIHNANGKSAGNVTRILVKVGEAGPVVETPDFKVSGVEKGDLSVADLKKLTATEKEYTVKGETEKARGVLLKDLLESLGVTDKDATFKIDAGGYGGEGTYNDISLKDAIDQDYLVAYEELVEGEWKAINDTSKTPNSKVRIYRNYMETHPEADQSKWFNKCQFLTGITVAVPQKTVFDVYAGTSQPGDLPLAGIRSTAMDKDGNLWVGTYGGGASYKAKGSDKFVTYNKASEPALNSATVSAVCPDGNGGVWMTQNSSYTDGTLNSGVAYMKDGAVKYYRASDNPATIPNDYVQEIKIDKNGNIWFGSFGGLTKYDPKAGTWQTWDAKDGFPAMSIDNIEFDSKGGIWCGFYPESEATDGSKPFKGGFAYFKDGSIKSYGYESKADDNTGAYRLGDVWVRDIAVDKNGAAWVVASGSYGGMKNTGGKVWYVSEPGAVPQEYTGFDLFGEDNFSTDSELRMVTVAPDGGLWFGTSKDGVFRVDDPTIVGGELALTDRYSSAAGSWHEGYDNIYSLDFYGNTLYAGSSTGLATHEFEFVNPEPPATDEFGDAVDSKDTADLTITGDALAKSGYFTIKGIKNWDGVNKVDATFHTLNSTGTEEDITVQGVTLENLIELAGMDEGAELDYVEIVSADGKTTIYTAEQALNEDLQGNKAMFIWKEGETKPQKVVRGQFSETDTNKGSWAKDAKKIIFHKKTVAEPFGDATADTADLTITGDALARDGYFTIKGIKNWDGVVKVDATFHTLNSTGTEEDITVQGVTLENIIELAGLAEGAVLDSVDIVSADGKTTIYTAEQALNEDLQGNKAMFIWKEGETKPQKVVRGQFSETDTNKGSWAKDAKKIIFHKKTESSEADKVIEAIDALPAADKITVDNADAIIAARAAYDALTDGEKALVTNLDKLEAAEAALDVIVKEEYIEKGEELIDDIDYSQYNATRAVALWLNINRLESKLNSADSAAEAAEICNKIKEAIANTPTEADEVRAALNDYPVEVKAKAGKTTIGLTWNTIPKAEAYDVYKSTSPADGFAMIRTVTDPAYTDTKTTIGRTYFYKVVPKTKVNEEFVFGEESAVISGKIKLAKPVIKSAVRSRTAFTLKWGKVTGASGYMIYASTKKTSGFKLYKTIKSGSKLSYVKKLKPLKRKGKTYYFKVKAYKVLDGKKIYSSMSSAKIMKRVR